MKKLFIIVLVILAMGLIGPKFVGNTVERQYEEIAQQFSSHPTLQIAERNFTKSWFGASSNIKLTFKGLDADVDNFQLILEEQLKFGPIIFANSGVKFAWSHSNLNVNVAIASANKEELAKFNQILADKLSIETLLSYHFNYTTLIALDAIDYTKDGSTLTIKPLNSETTLTTSNILTSQLIWQGASVSTPEQNVTVEQLTMDIEQEIISGNIFSGDALSFGDFSVLIKSIAAADSQGNSLLSIDQLTMSGSSQINEKLMDVKLNYHANEFIGQGLTLKNMNLDLSFYNFDSDVLMALNELNAQMQSQPERIAEYSQQVIAKATELLKHNPKINIDDLSVETPSGLIKSDIQLMVDGNLYQANNPMSIIGAMNANAKGNAPFSFFQQLGLEPMINMYIDQGLILLEQDTLSFTASFENGSLLVNGNPLNF